MLPDRDLFIEDVQQQQETRGASASGHHGEMQKSNIALYHGNRGVASFSTILLELLEKLQKREEKADRLHAFEAMQSNILIN